MKAVVGPGDRCTFEEELLRSGIAPIVSGREATSRGRRGAVHTSYSSLAMAAVFSTSRRFGKRNVQELGWRRMRRFIKGAVVCRS